MTGGGSGGRLVSMEECRRTLLALALALSAGGCERRPEADHLDRIRSLCGQLADASAGLAEAERVLGPPQLELCAADLPPGSAEDRCPTDGTSICVRVWVYRARDEDLCGGTACSYGCEIRAPQEAPEQTCSVRFLSGFESPGSSAPNGESPGGVGFLTQVPSLYTGAARR
jgi:hypothetical protein